jgi:EAL and modified HD-GYP domain-containing signal transduction protein
VDEMYVARQPIFTSNMKVYGYELLCRTNRKSHMYTGSNSNRATATVMNELFELGLDKLVGSKKAFVNFDYEFIMSDLIELIHPDELVIEVLEGIKIDEFLLDKIMNLKEKQYKIALDDFAEDYASYPILPFADIIKYDVLLTPLDTLEFEVKEALKQKKILLAEKIETKDIFLQAKRMGFHLFQGYFFSRPSFVSGVKTLKSNNAIYQQILLELHSEEPSFHVLTDLIRSDINLAYHIVRSTRKLDITNATIHKCLVRLGLNELERWIHVLILQELASNKPDELIRIALVRSKFGELIAANSSLSHRKYEISLMCLFSVLDAMLDTTMELALSDISISLDAKNLLIHHRGVFRPIYDILTCYEQGDIEPMHATSEQIHLDPKKLFTYYLESIEWSEKIMFMFYTSSN